MKMETFSCNSMREAKLKINELGITKENLIGIFQDRDGLFVVTYYTED